MTEDRPLDDELLANLSEDTGGPTDAKYTPTLREIQIAKNKIQAKWTEGQRNSRRTGEVDVVPYTIPEATPRASFIRRRGGIHGSNNK